LGRCHRGYSRLCRVWCGAYVKALQTILILFLWPYWVIKACLTCAAGVSLIAAREILDVWAPSKT